jgi:uncharacterized protein DUF6600
MNAKNRSTARVGLVLGSALALAATTGCQTSVVHSHPRAVYVPAPTPVVNVPAPAPQVSPVVVVSSPAPAPVVVIRSESDFYEPLGAYGRWAVVGNYGRCWIPTRAEAGWRPYGNGYWQRTDAGWYWASDEPWAWATYHYGRWDWRAEFGWIWMPQTQWAPAWVSWREGGGYVGWAPLRPSVSFGVTIGAVDYEPAFASRAFVFVEHRRMLEPVRPKTVIVNNTTIINKTINITKVNVVNKTVINEGPHPEVIERESGRKIQTIPVREFRRQEEANTAAREWNIPTAAERKVQRSIRTEPQPVQAPAPPRRNIQVVEREPLIAKPTERVPRPAQPITRTKPAGPEVTKTDRGDEEREAEITPKARPARIVEAKVSPEAQTERVNPDRHPTRAFERSAEVAKPALPAVATNNEVRRKTGTERIVSARPSEPRLRSEARTEPKAEMRQPLKVETPPPVVATRPVASVERQNQKPQVSAREKSRPAERVETNQKKKEAKDQKNKGEEQEVPSAAADLRRQLR